MLTIFPWIKLHLTYKNIYVYIYIYIYGILYFKKTWSSCQLLVEIDRTALSITVRVLLQ